MIFSTPIELLLKIIYCHVLGDYVLSSNYIQTTKYENFYHLIIHCILYTIPFYFCFGLDKKLLIVFLTHIFIDFAKIKNEINYVYDQILHYIVVLFLYIF